MKLEDRLKKHSNLNPDTGCIEWISCKNNGGYGALSIKGKWAMAHRVSYEINRGSIPDGFDIDHLCRNRSCINPFHLEAVPRRENLMRGIRTNQNAAKKFCINGHELSGENLYIKPNGARRCKECARIRDRKYYWQGKSV